MDRRAALWVNVSVGAVACGDHLCKSYEHLKVGQWSEGKKEIYSLALTVSDTALAIFSPTVHLLINQSCALLDQLRHFKNQLDRREWENASKQCLTIICTGINLSSAIFNRTELHALSLFIQMAKELHKATGELSKGRLLETVANVALACIRGAQAANHIQSLHQKLRI